jgi:hypothetical protein
LRLHADIAGKPALVETEQVSQILDSFDNIAELLRFVHWFATQSRVRNQKNGWAAWMPTDKPGGATTASAHAERATGIGAIRPPQRPGKHIAARIARPVILRASAESGPPDDHHGRDWPQVA